MLHRAISHSGTSYSPHAFVKHGAAQALKLAANIGCNSESLKALMACLRQAPASSIVNAIPSMHV